MRFSAFNETLVCTNSATIVMSQISTFSLTEVSAVLGKEKLQFQNSASHTEPQSSSVSSESVKTLGDDRNFLF